MLDIPEEVKNLCKQDSVRKNFRVIFLNKEHEDLTNANVEFESVSFSESVCSRGEIKFGLCESSSISFTTINVSNIKDMIICPRLEIDISSLGEDWIAEHGFTSDDVDYPFYPIPYGVFVVDSCDRDSTNMAKREVEAITPVGYNHWCIDEMSLAIMDEYIFKTDRGNFDLSMEALMQFAFPDGSDFKEVEFDNQLSVYYKELGVVDGTRYGIRVTSLRYATADILGDMDVDWYVTPKRYSYDASYISKMAELRALLRSLGLTTSIPVPIRSSRPDYLYYHKAGNLVAGFDYTRVIYEYRETPTPVDENGHDYDFPVSYHLYSNVLQPRNEAIFTIYPTRQIIKNIGLTLMLAEIVYRG